mmetsp:Transcript_10790/g.16219  ORF Transcript_10790/g.16219 Transcript_10790/m.16219 type:complete len:197 (-) Transcript_10790:2444-3034(-)
MPTDTTIGKWRDPLCSCYKYGCCHPLFLNACCCQQILLAQIMTRLKLTACGKSSATTDKWRYTFRIMVVLTIIYYTLKIMLPDFLLEERGLLMPTGKYVTVLVILNHFISVTFFCYCCYILTLTRRFIRERDGIPATSSLEDACVSIWCSCCVISQCALQTANYEFLRAECCSNTGVVAMSLDQESHEYSSHIELV